MEFSVLIYNTLFNRGFENIGAITSKYAPDFLCLQEVDTSDDNLNKIRQYGYELADYANSFIKFDKVYGAATFYNANKFRFLSSDSFDISTNISEWFYTLVQLIFGINKPKTVLRTDFVDRSMGKKVTLCNMHLIVIASNALRVNHINKALKWLRLPKGSGLVVGGDFNYLPYQRKRLEKTMKRYGLTEATKNVHQTIEFSQSGKKEKMNIFQAFFIKQIDKFFAHHMKNDYVFYKNLRLRKNQRLEVRYSDHFPILSVFKI